MRPRPRDLLRERFPAPTAGHPLPDELVDLYPPRAQVALAAILERIETELRAPSVQAALRLAVVHMVAVDQPAQRLSRTRRRRCASAAGTSAGSSSRQWRERNAWTAFEEGTRAVREFVQAIEVGRRAHAGPRRARTCAPCRTARPTWPCASACPMVVRPSGHRRAPAPSPAPARASVPGIKLVLSQPPIHWSADNLAFAYLASSLAIGPEGAATLPLAHHLRLGLQGRVGS